MRVTPAKKPASTSRSTEAKRLPPIGVGPALSKKIDKAIISPGNKTERQLKFTTRTGFVSPSGNPLQVVYLTPAATKSGLDITYVDTRAKQFWAQAPGTSGLARGPFKLPTGVAPALDKVTAKELKAEAKPRRNGAGGSMHPSGGGNYNFGGGSGGKVRPKGGGGSGGYMNPSGGGGNYNFGGGGSGGGGGGGGSSWGS